MGCLSEKNRKNSNYLNAKFLYYFFQACLLTEHKGKKTPKNQTNQTNKKKGHKQKKNMTSFSLSCSDIQGMFRNSLSGLFTDWHIQLPDIQLPQDLNWKNFLTDNIQPQV